MQLSACGFATRMGFRSTEVPAALFYPGKPGIVADPATATQADVANAYPETAAAWEACAVNLSEIQKIIQGVKQR